MQVAVTKHAHRSGFEVSNAKPVGLEGTYMKFLTSNN